MSLDSIICVCLFWNISVKWFYLKNNSLGTLIMVLILRKRLNFWADEGDKLISMKNLILIWKPRKPDYLSVYSTLMPLPIFVRLIDIYFQVSIANVIYCSLAKFPWQLYFINIYANVHLCAKSKRFCLNSKKQDYNWIGFLFPAFSLGNNKDGVQSTDSSTVSSKSIL